MRHWVAVGAVAILFLTGPVVAQARTCSTVDLDEPFVLPDGSQHAAGKLTLCRAPVSSPSEALYVSYVNRAPIGLLFGRRGRSEAPTDRQPFMMFARDHAGRLHLYGLGVPRQDGTETFRFERFPLRASRGGHAVSLAS